MGVAECERTGTDAMKNLERILTTPKNCLTALQYLINETIKEDNPVWQMVERRFLKLMKKYPSSENDLDVSVLYLKGRYRKIKEIAREIAVNEYCGEDFRGEFNGGKTYECSGAMNRLEYEAEGIIEKWKQKKVGKAGELGYGLGRGYRMGRRRHAR